MFGCNSNICYVDLTTKSVRIEIVEEETLLSYLGGRGINSYLLNRDFIKLYSPLDPRNITIVSAGLFVNTSAPSSGRTCISFLMNAEGTSWTDSNMGGRFSTAMKSAGIDILYITGKCSELCYILVEDGKVSIRDAKFLKGLNTYETDTLLKERHHNARTISIGPAGEQLSPYANLIHEDRSASGPGSVWGSKNLKAICAVQKPTINLAKNQDAFSKECEILQEYIKSHPLFTSFSKHGTALLSRVHNKIGNYPSYNWKYGRDDLAVHNINEETLFNRSVGTEEKKKEFENENFACFNCALGGCSNLYELPGQRHLRKVEYESANCFSGKLGNSSLEDVLELNLYCNDQGIDLIKITSALSTLMDMGKLAFSSSLKEIKCNIDNIILGSLSYYLTEEDDKEKYKERFVEVKGKAISSFDPRIGWGAALSCATASRGGDHLRSLPTILSYFNWYNETFGKDNLSTFSKWCGIPVQTLQKWKNRGVFTDKIDGKELVVKYYQEVNAVFDSLGMCRFMSPWRFGIGYCRLVIPLSELTGIYWLSEDIQKAGERISAVERQLLQKYNQTDYLPKRFFEEDTESKNKLKKEQFDVLLQKYYKECNYTEEGYLSPKILKDLSIETFEK